MNNPISKFIDKRKKQNRQSMIIDNFYTSDSDDKIDSESNSSLVEMNIKHFEEQTLKEQYIYQQQEQQKAHNSLTSTECENKSYRKDFCKNHMCEICNNSKDINNYMILNCGHIYHINCLVECHYSNSNKYGVIDQDFINSCTCLICNEHMEIEDISHIHNKFVKSTNMNISKQQDNIFQVEKQINKLKDEMRTLMEYKQRLEHQKERSKQITISMNTFI